MYVYNYHTNIQQTYILCLRIIVQYYGEIKLSKMMPSNKTSGQRIVTKGRITVLSLSRRRMDSSDLGPHLT